MGELQKTFQNDKQVEHCINRAQFELRKAARPDYYGLLGVPSIASTLEIKAAYKKRALECHPDKHSDGGDAARAAAEAEFKALGEALFEVLDDDFKRKRTTRATTRRRSRSASRPPTARRRTTARMAAGRRLPLIDGPVAMASGEWASEFGTGDCDCSGDEVCARVAVNENECDA